MLRNNADAHISSLGYLWLSKQLDKKSLKYVLVSASNYFAYTKR